MRAVNKRQRVLSSEDENLNDRVAPEEEYGGVGKLEESPSPYENEDFEVEDGGDNMAYHGRGGGEHESDGAGEYGVEEDVSSEGSCRTSIYQRSQKGDDSDSNKNSNQQPQGSSTSA